jgi:hypothetical protein
MTDFNKWIEDWINLTDKNKQCPYAKPALQLNKVKITKLDNIDNAYDFWLEVSCAAEHFNNDYDVVIVGMDTDASIITEIQLLSGSDSFNANLNYRNKDVWALTLFSNVYTLILLQNITKLDDASKILEKKDQYKNYHPYRYNKDVILRRKLRNNLK